MRIENIEFREVPKEPEKYELVQWNEKNNEEGEWCIVLAFYILRSEGYEIRTIGSRLFETDNDKLTWAMLRYGQAICDAKFNLSEEICQF